jgi:hypothetical protein
VAELVAQVRQPGPPVGQRLGCGHVGHGELVLQALLGHLEAGRQVEDRLAVLDRDDPPRGERAAVAHPLDLVEDRHRRIAGAQEVGVQRVDVAGRVVDRPCRRHQRLAGHLAPEDALALLLWGDPSEEVHLDGLEIEHPDEVVDRRLRHAGPR